MAPSLVKYVLVDESQGAWCLCVSVCVPHVVVTVGAFIRLADDLPVEVGNCCTQSNDWSSEKHLNNTKLLGGAKLVVSFSCLSNRSNL